MYNVNEHIAKKFLNVNKELKGNFLDEHIDLTTSHTEIHLFRFKFDFDICLMLMIFRVDAKLKEAFSASIMIIAFASTIKLTFEQFFCTNDTLLASFLPQLSTAFKYVFPIDIELE